MWVESIVCNISVVFWGGHSVCASYKSIDRQTEVQCIARSSRETAAYNKSGIMTVFIFFHRQLTLCVYVC